jgi:hypothetical protein
MEEELFLIVFAKIKKGGGQRTAGWYIKNFYAYSSLKKIFLL